MGAAPRPQTTLGDLLYANKGKTPVSEKEWVELVQSIANGDQVALHALYERTHRLVFTLIVRITGNRATAEELTLDVFHDVWRRASAYKPDDGSVVGWMMNQARSRAIDTNPVRLGETPTGAGRKIEGRMSSGSGKHDRDYAELVFLYVLQALPADEVPGVEAHISACAECRQDMETLRPIIGAFVSWPADVLRPSAPLWERLTRRIASETGQRPLLPAPPGRGEPEWEEAAPGISCKLLATDTEKDRVSMLVRLAPGAAYPPHRHAGVEELYLLDGELMIDDKKLYPGDYNRAEAGTADQRVWSETGCTCVLLTSTRDVLR